MRIAVFSEILPSDFVSGVAVYTIDLVKSLVKEGHEVIVFAPKMKYKIPSELDAVKIVKIPAVPTMYPDFKVSVPYTFNIVRQTLKDKPDIIHLQGPSFLGIDGLICAKLLDIPTVATFHTLFTDKKYIQNITKISWGLDTLEKVSWGYHRWFYNSVDGIFVATPKLRDDLINHNFDKKKIKIAPVFVDLSEVRILETEQKAELKKKYHLREKVAVFLGRISQEKSIDFILESWRDLSKNKDNLSLLIIGNGPYEKILKKRIKEWHLEKSIVLLGQIEHKHLFSSGILSIADVYVSASQTETFGLAGLEAMAHQVPVILVKSQGLCEVIDGGGILIKPNDKGGFIKAIASVFDSPKYQQKLARKAKEVALRYDSQNAIKETIRLYRQFI